jgi:hypothetical protein
VSLAAMLVLIAAVSFIYEIKADAAHLRDAETYLNGTKWVIGRSRQPSLPDPATSRRRLPSFTVG